MASWSTLHGPPLYTTAVYSALGFRLRADMGSSTALHTTRYKAFLALLRQAREEAGLTQVQVAEKLGRPQTWVSKCELGERRVDFVELEEFAKVYRKKLDWFRTGD